MADDLTPNKKAWMYVSAVFFASSLHWHIGLEGRTRTFMINLGLITWLWAKFCVIHTLKPSLKKRFYFFIIIITSTIVLMHDAIVLHLCMYNIGETRLAKNVHNIYLSLFYTITVLPMQVFLPMDIPIKSVCMYAFVCSSSSSTTTPHHPLLLVVTKSVCGCC